ncbi:MAG: hypothetical protein KBS63_05850 [Clostridiales bacterium]|nr:hypothetical protein [Candidatus Crickella caballi]
MFNKLSNKKGSASTVIILVVLVIGAIIGLYLKLNWKRFKADASFGFAIAAMGIAILLIIYLCIRSKIKKAKKRKAKEKEAKEAAEKAALIAENERLNKENDLLEEKINKED